MKDSINRNNLTLSSFKNNKRRTVNYSFPNQTRVTRAQRESLLNQRSVLIWFTGLSGSGKSTLSIQLESILHKMGYKTYLLDGDNIRSGLNKDLSFTDASRKENIRRVAEVSKLFLDAGYIVLCAFISPFKVDREQVKEIIGAENHVEVFVNCPLNICEQRDPKGLYKKARAGVIKHFTGIDSPYERPEYSDIIINTDKMSIDNSIKTLMNFILNKIQVEI